MKILVLADDAERGVAIRNVAQRLGHLVRVQKVQDGPAETRVNVHWAQMVVAAGDLRDNAIGALYLAFDLKRDIRLIHVTKPAWAVALWPSASACVWAASLPVMPEQTKLFT